MKIDINEFTENNYEKLLVLCKNKYNFITYQEAVPDVKSVVWRHDVDMSPQRALALAKIEANQNVKSTYFFMLTSDFYNLLEPINTNIVKEINEMGHKIGIHIDAKSRNQCSNNNKSLEELLYEERFCFEKFLSVSPHAFSFHNPDVGGWLEVEEGMIAGMYNAYSTTMKTEYKYCSDSNGYWRFDCLSDVIAADYQKPLHILTHPEWWVQNAMSPRDRIVRAATGRLSRCLERYDDFLNENGRLNIGK